MDPSLANTLPDQNFQFERQEYVVADRVDHIKGSKPVFNLAVGLRGSLGLKSMKLHHPLRSL